MLGWMVPRFSVVGITGDGAAMLVMHGCVAGEAVGVGMLDAGVEWGSSGQIE
jgi:hypothetical protein